MEEIEQYEKPNKFDNFWLGLVLGTIIPPIASYGVYYWFNRTNSYFEFIQKLKTWGIQTEVFLWCVLPIAFVFALFYFLHYDRAAKGVVFPTMIYTIILLILDL
ncbi:MAG: hypothetical protein MJ204_03360 [Bacteroidales bacterium]|nr:hypothetical protein [Bacteroidales bacterium]